MATTCIELKQLVTQRSQLALTKPIDAQFDTGKVWQLVGENGRGKTTLLMTIAGLLTPLEGKVVYTNPAPALYFGHQSGMNSQLTVFENLQFLTGLYDHQINHKAIQSALAPVGLLGYEDTPVGQLSSGQKRRVQLARLWLPNCPQIWLLDEPYTALDVYMVADLEQRLAEHAQLGGLVILTSHQPVNVVTDILDLNNYLPQHNPELWFEEDEVQLQSSVDTKQAIWFDNPNPYGKKNQNTSNHTLGQQHDSESDVSC